MKRPPILIIINLIILAAGYLCCIFAVINKLNSGACISEKLIDFLSWLSLTLYIIGIYIAVIKHQYRSIFLLGLLLLLLGFINCSWPYSLPALIIILLPFYIGISFIVWGIILSVDSSNLPENTARLSRYKYWLYSANAFCATGIIVAILGRFIYELDVSKNHEFQRKIIFPATWSLLLIGILQIIVYYILCNIRERREKNMNNTEKN